MQKRYKSANRERDAKRKGIMKNYADKNLAGNYRSLRIQKTCG